MKAIRVYQCLCDQTRLRILNLLLKGPLCVCHLAAILEVEQPKISRHLRALKEAGAIETERCHNWTICRIPENPNPILETNLKCLQDLRGEEPLFTADLVTRKEKGPSLVTDCGEAPARIRELFANPTSTHGRI